MAEPQLSRESCQFEGFAPETEEYRKVAPTREEFRQAMEDAQKPPLPPKVNYAPTKG